MSIENFLDYSVDSEIIYHYLKLLADKNIKIERCNEDLAKKLKLSEDSFSALHREFLTIQQKLELESNKSLWSEDVKKDQYGSYVELVIQGVCSRFRWIQPGSFMMGSPTSKLQRGGNETLHDVTLTQGFWMADTACTQALWLAVMGSNPAYFSSNFENPVEKVSWNDVQLFLQRANDLVSTKGGLRLPSEAEWEYACRAGTNTPFSFGSNATPSLANCRGNYPSGGDNDGLYREKTIPVKSLHTNRWGLYQMHGNVYEWCQDWNGDGFSSTSDPKGANSGTSRVLRSGSWGSYAQYMRSACRAYLSPNYSDYYIGFRLVLNNQLQRKLNNEY